eukprot:1363891-Amorphochlora_amoeboformis.AAC.1
MSESEEITQEYLAYWFCSGDRGVWDGGKKEGGAVTKWHGEARARRTARTQQQFTHPVVSLSR